MPGQIALFIRFTHLVGMVLLLGGASYLWLDLRRDGDSDSLATEYEWAFWGTMGLMLVTGVGNLGSLGPPPPTTQWGTILTLKLAIVGVFVVGSFLRTVLVLQSGDGGRSTGVTRESLRLGYGLTAASLLLIVALAEVLAHG